MTRTGWPEGLCDKVHLSENQGGCAASLVHVDQEHQAESGTEVLRGVQQGVGAGSHQGGRAREAGGWPLERRPPLSRGLWLSSAPERKLPKGLSRERKMRLS